MIDAKNEWSVGCNAEKLQHLPPPPSLFPGQTPGHLNFRSSPNNWCSNAPPYNRINFVFQIPLLKNNRCKLLSALIKLVYKHANTFRDPLYDGPVFTRLELLQKHNFNIETIKKWFEIHEVGQCQSASVKPHEQFLYGNFYVEIYICLCRWWEVTNFYVTTAFAEKLAC